MKWKKTKIVEINWEKALHCRRINFSARIIMLNLCWTMPNACYQHLWGECPNDSHGICMLFSLMLKIHTCIDFLMVSMSQISCLKKTARWLIGLRRMFSPTPHRSDQWIACDGPQWRKYQHVFFKQSIARQFNNNEEGGLRRIHWIGRKQKYQITVISI